MKDRRVKVVLSKARNLELFEIEKIENALFVTIGTESFSAGNRLEESQAEELLNQSNIDITVVKKK